MKKWNVWLTVGASVLVEVLAETEEQAKKIALDTADYSGLCWQCANELEVGDITGVSEVELVYDDELPPLARLEEEDGDGLDTGGSH